MSNFRSNVEKTLGIPEKNHVDLYTMVESNWHAMQCPEGHYLHLPPTIVYPMVLDENLKPIGYEETGRLAFIDPLANSYPGAITVWVQYLHQRSEEHQEKRSEAAQRRCVG